MQSTTIISELIKQGRAGTQDLYSKIPFFLRTRLDAIITKQLWTRVNEGCQQNDASSLDCARNMYRHVLQAADEYINAYAKKAGTDNCVLMMMDKNHILKTFDDDAAAFVLEMDRCLQGEKELIFIYQGELTEPEMAEHNEDITDQDEDADITLIEVLTQEVNSQLVQAKRLLQEFDQDLDIREELMASFNQDPNVAESLREDVAEELRHYDIEIQSLLMNRDQKTSRLVACKQSVVNGMAQLNLLCCQFAERLTENLDAWKIAEAKRSVKVGPETNTGALLNKAKRFGAVINTVLCWFAEDGDIQFIRNAEQMQGSDIVEFFIEVGRMQLEFQKILNNLVQIVVTAQPKGVISIENKGKKDSPNYCTKKTQPFSSTVRVLAGESFLNFHILSKKVELVAEKDLAQGSSAEVVGRDGNSCLKVEAVNLNNLPEIQFNIEVKNFCRLEQNNVYKQFFRLVYEVKVSIHGTEYSLKTMSLPFTFNTGANQILEHMGARMWYCASVQDLYNGGFQCPDPLSTDEVINILDNRIAYIGNKTRRLTPEEKTFLKGRLPVASDDTVTMQGFLKDKMKTLRSEDTLNYSFYTWFYSVTHTFELLLLEAWQDGIIYGFCSDKTAEQLLMDPRATEGSFLLRPCVSETKKTSSADATAGITMEVKLRKRSAHPFDGHSSEFEVISVPLFYKHIEKNTLYGAIKGIECNGKPVAKWLYNGQGGGRKLDVLKRYVKKQEQKFIPEYRMLMEKMEKINIRHCTSRPAAATAEDASDEDEEPIRRKRRYRKSSSSTQVRSNSQSPSVSAAASDSPSGSATSSLFTSLSSGEMKQENPQQMQFQSGGAVNEQCQRSGIQGKTIAGTTDEDGVDGNIGEEYSDFLEHEIKFGAIKVDVSHINLMTATCTSPHGQNGLSAANGQNGYPATNGQNSYPAGNGQNGYPATNGQNGYPAANGQNSYPAVNSSGLTGTEVTNSLQYNTQHQENGMNNCFMDSASSPASANNDGFNIRDQSTLDTDFPMPNFTPASVRSNFSESFPSSPGRTQMSPPGVDTQFAASLPTVLNGAKEYKRQVQQRGSRGNRQSNPNVKSATSSRPTVKPVVVIPNGGQRSSSSFEVTPMSLQNQTYTVYADAVSYIVDLQMENSLTSFSTINTENIEATQLFESLVEQRASLQLSPDSGLGDQSPSPESIWRGHPLSSGFQRGSNIIDTTNVTHI